MVTIDILVVDETILESLAKHVEASIGTSADGYVAAYNSHIHGCSIVSVNVENSTVNVIPLHPDLIGSGEHDIPPICNMVLTVRNSMYGIGVNVSTRDDAPKFLAMDMRLCHVVKSRMIYADFDEIKRLKVEDRVLHHRDYRESTYAVTDSGVGCNFIVVKRVPIDILRSGNREQILTASDYIVHSGLAVNNFMELLRNGKG